MAVDATARWSGITDEDPQLTTELNSLTDDGLSAASAAFDNGAAADRHTNAHLEVTLASLNPTGSPFVIVYVTRALDGTTYEDAPAAGGANFSGLKFKIPVSTGTGAKLAASKMISLPPCPVKFYLENQLNVNLGASGNTLDLYTHNIDSTS